MDEKWIREQAQIGRVKVKDYCDGAEADLENIRRLQELADMTTMEDPETREIVLAAFSSSMNLVVNFRALSQALGILIKLAE